MKLILSILFAGISSGLFAQQSPAVDTVTLVANFYTRQSSNFQGSYNMKTTDGEKGDLTIKSSNNIKWFVTPAELSIKPNEEKTWQGSITPDDISIPLPGTQEYGWIKGDYDISVKSVNPEDPFETKLINPKGSESLHFIIYSLNVEFDCKEDVYLLPGQSLDVNALAFPSGGNYTWSNPLGVKTEGDINSSQMKIQAGTDVSEGSLKLTYELKGVSFTKLLHVHILQPKLPEIIKVDGGVTSVDLLVEDNNLDFSFTPTEGGFFVKKSGNDGFLISTSQDLIKLEDDPFSQDNLFYQVNKTLGYQYPNLQLLANGQLESDPLPPIPAQLPENSSPEPSTPSSENLIYGTEPNLLNEQKFFSKSITVVRKSDPSVVLGKIIVKLEN